MKRIMQRRSRISAGSHPALRMRIKLRSIRVKEIIKLLGGGTLHVTRSIKNKVAKKSHKRCWFIKVRYPSIKGGFNTRWWFTRHFNKKENSNVID
jgi:hypothetical protein